MDDITDQSEVVRNQEPLRNRPCTLSDLEHNFYPMNEVNDPYIKALSPYMTCVDDLSALELYAALASTMGRIVIFQVETCHGKDYCRSDDEIKAFVELHSILLIFN